MIKILKTLEFETWFISLSLQQQKLVDTRLLRIEENEHFGATFIISAAAKLAAVEHKPHFSPQK